MSARKSEVKDLDSAVLSSQAIRGYSLGKAAEGMGRELIRSDVTNYFMTGILAIEPVAAANIRLLSSVFDAVNDPFIGVCIDRFKGKKRSKLYQALLWGPVFAALFSIMFFISVSNMSAQIKSVYYAAALVGWDLSFSFYDISLNALPFNMTNNSVERAKLFGFSSILKSLCAFIPIGLLQCTLFVPFFEKYINIYYIVLACLVSLFTLVLSRYPYFETQEQKSLQRERPSVYQCFKYLFKNKPLFMLFIANIFSVLVCVSSAVQMYFAVDLMGNIKYKLLLIIAGIPSIFFAGLFIPRLVKILGRKTNFKLLYIICCVIAAAIHFFSFITFRMLLLDKPDGELPSISAVVYILTLTALAAMPFECRRIISKEMEAQSVDYAEWVYGKRLEGTMASLITFSEKLTSSLSSWLALLIIGAAGYVSHTTYASVSQTPRAKSALLICSTALPMLGYLLMLIPICFYDINGDEYERMIIDIRRRIVKSKYISQSSITDLFSGMTEEEIAALTQTEPLTFRIQHLGDATLNAKGLYSCLTENHGVDGSWEFEAVDEAVEIDEPDVLTANVSNMSASPSNADNSAVSADDDDYILSDSAEFEEDALQDEDLIFEE